MRDKTIKIQNLAKTIANDANAGRYGVFCVFRLFYLDSDGVQAEHEGEYVFTMDEHEENEEVRQRLVNDLFEDSLRWRIKQVKTRIQGVDLEDTTLFSGYPKEGYYVLGYRLYLERADDGETNITSELMESIMEVFKQ